LSAICLSSNEALLAIGLSYGLQCCDVRPERQLQAADNPNNAYNVNFNSDNVNWNNNNRYNGFSVRSVSAFMMNSSAPIFDTYPDQLLLDLYRAYKDARRHKRRRDYQLRFERNIEIELLRLRDAILSGGYRPEPSTCFIIHDPKMREAFAGHLIKGFGTI